ncbi:MAG: peptide deformylase [Clostridia bacterium]|nr:peptide deformylase [Clostridia bacterium]
MAIRNIVKMGDSVLRKNSKPVENFDEKLWQLLDDMKQTLDKIQGLGLSAVQVGVLKQVIIIDYEDQFLEIINPKILATSGSCYDNEGCLSVVGFRGIVERPETIDLEYFDRFGNKKSIHAEGYFARVFFHEIDHLYGVLFCDKMIRRVSGDE